MPEDQTTEIPPEQPQSRAQVAANNIQDQLVNALGKTGIQGRIAATTIKSVKKHGFLKTFGVIGLLVLTPFICVISIALFGIYTISQAPQDHIGELAKTVGCSIGGSDVKACLARNAVQLGCDKINERVGENVNCSLGAI